MPDLSVLHGLSTRFCMNSELRSLKAEVSDLRDEVETLRGELVKVRRAVSDIRLGAVDPIRESAEESEDSYSVVSEYPPSSAAAGGAYSTAGSVVNRPSTSASPSPPCVLSWREREEIADQIGHFIARSVSGQHRGLSGREKVPLASRLWVVVRDYAGQIYSPVKVVRSWSSAKLLVKRGQDCGDSIFVGFASEREGRRAIAVAGLNWPSIIEA